MIILTDDISKRIPKRLQSHDNEAKQVKTPKLDQTSMRRRWPIKMILRSLHSSLTSLKGTEVYIYTEPRGLPRPILQHTLHIITGWPFQISPLRIPSPTTLRDVRSCARKKANVEIYIYVRFPSAKHRWQIPYSGSTSPHLHT